MEIKNYITEIDLSPTNSNKIQEIINLIILEEGFDIDNSFIGKCLNKNNIVIDIELFEKYYFQSNFQIPIRKVETKFEYYNNDCWNPNTNFFIEKVILTNIINTYLEFSKKDNNEILDEDNNEILNEDKSLNCLLKILNILKLKQIKNIGKL